MIHGAVIFKPKIIISGVEKLKLRVELNGRERVG